MVHYCDVIALIRFHPLQLYTRPFVSSVKASCFDRRRISKYTRVDDGCLLTLLSSRIVGLNARQHKSALPLSLPTGLFRRYAGVIDLLGQGAAYTEGVDGQGALASSGNVR